MSITTTTISDRGISSVEVTNAVWDATQSEHTTSGSTGSLVGKTLITFDNEIVSMTASTTNTTTPATGECDNGMVVPETVISTSDTFNVSSDGSDYVQLRELLGVQDAEAALGVAFTLIPVTGMGNSDGRYRMIVDATVGTRTIQQILTTVAEAS